MTREMMENPGTSLNFEIRKFTSDVDRDRSVPVALRVPGKSRQRNTPMTACRTQRRSAPSVRNATLISTARFMAEIETKDSRAYFSRVSIASPNDIDNLPLA